MHKYTAFIALLTSFNCYSNDFRLSIGIGRENIDLASSTYASTGSLHFGYVLPNNFMIDAGYSSTTNLNWYKSVDFKTQEILLGYRYEHNSFYFEPKLGYAKWHIDLGRRESTNPEPEKRFRDSGIDPFITLTTGYRFNNLFGMSLSYKHLDFGDGDTQSYILGFDFIF